MGVAVGLDFGAALALADALEADRGLLAECLPAIEALLVNRANGSGDEADGPQGEFDGFGASGAADVER